MIQKPPWLSWLMPLSVERDQVENKRVTGCHSAALGIITRTTKKMKQKTNKQKKAHTNTRDCQMGIKCHSSGKENRSQSELLLLRILGGVLNWHSEVTERNGLTADRNSDRVQFVVRVRVRYCYCQLTNRNLHLSLVLSTLTLDLGANCLWSAGRSLWLADMGGGSRLVTGVYAPIGIKTKSEFIFILYKKNLIDIHLRN